MTPFLPHSMRTPSFPYINQFNLEEEEKEESTSQEQQKNDDEIVNISSSKNTRNSFDRMLEGMNKDLITSQRTTPSPVPSQATASQNKNNLTSHGRKFPSLSPRTDSSSGSNNTMQPLSLSRSAPDLARRYREEGDLGVVIRRTGINVGLDLMNENITSSGGTSSTSHSGRKKVSGFSSLFSKVGRKKMKQAPTPLSLRTTSSHSNLNANQRKEILLPSPTISSPVNTPRLPPGREQSYFSVPRSSRRTGSQESDQLYSPPFKFTAFPTNSNVNTKIDNFSSSTSSNSNSTKWSKSQFSAGTSESGNTTPRGNSTFPRGVQSPHRNYITGFSSSNNRRFHDSDNDEELRNDQDFNDENYYPPSPFLPSRIPLPSTPSDHSNYSNKKTYDELDNNFTPPRTNSENLLPNLNPLISIRRPSIPDSPPISIHKSALSSPLRRRNNNSKRGIESKTSSFSSSFQGIDYSSSSLLSRPSYDYDCNSVTPLTSTPPSLSRPESIVGGGWTGMLLGERGRSETSGTLSEFENEVEFPWFVLGGGTDSLESPGLRGGGRRKSTFDFGNSEGTSCRMELKLEVKQKQKQKRHCGIQILEEEELLPKQQDRTFYFSSSTRTSSEEISNNSENENENENENFEDTESEGMNSEDTSHNRPFHYLSSIQSFFDSTSVPPSSPPPFPPPPALPSSPGINLDDQLLEDSQNLSPPTPRRDLIFVPLPPTLPPHSPGLKTLRLVNSTLSLRSSSNRGLKRTESQDKHQSDPTSNNSNNNNNSTSECSKQALSIISSSSESGPKRPSFESEETFRKKEEGILFNTLPLSIPIRSTPSQFKSIAVQTEISFPLFQTQDEIMNTSTPPRRSSTTRRSHLSQPFNTPPPPPLTTTKINFLSPINFKIDRNLSMLGGNDFPSPSSSLNVNYFSSAPPSPIFDPSNSNSNSSNTDASKSSEFENVGKFSSSNSNSNSIPHSHSPFSSSPSSTLPNLDISTSDLLQVSDNLNDNLNLNLNLISTLTPTRPPRSQKRSTKIQLPRQNDSISSFNTNSTGTMMREGLGLIPSGNFEIEYTSTGRQDDSMMDEREDEDEVLPEGENQEDLDWGREKLELRERNEVLELEIGRLKRVVAILIGLDPDDENNDDDD